MKLSRALRPALLSWQFFCFAWAFLACSWAAAKQSILLNKGWEFRQVTNLQGIAHDQWLPAKVPGDVHLDLLRNKLIPEPFYRDNETKLQWIENADWEYRTTIPVSEKLLDRQNIDLVFDGLDTCAQVYLNGNLLLTSDNMFRTYRLNAKPYLKVWRQSSAHRFYFAHPGRRKNCRSGSVASGDPYAGAMVYPQSGLSVWMGLGAEICDQRRVASSAVGGVGRCAHFRPEHSPIGCDQAVRPCAGSSGSNGVCRFAGDGDRSLWSGRQRIDCHANDGAACGRQPCRTANHHRSSGAVVSGGIWQPAAVCVSCQP